MKFDKIFHEIIQFWPDKIDISDGYYIHQTDGYFFPRFSKISGKIEENMGIKNEWKKLMVWSIFQVLHAEAKELFKKGIKNLEIKKIDIQKFKNNYRKNLETEGYEDVLKKFIENNE